MNISEELLARIRKKVEAWLNEEAETIEKFSDITDNTVFKVTAAGKPWIFKIYTLRDWPEDGKLKFINEQLRAHGIGCAQLVVFDRNDPDFPTGYLIEECLPGTAADRVLTDPESEKAFYRKLARLMSQVHRIRIRNHGYIGSGVASHGTFLEFMDDKIDEIGTQLIRMNRFSRQELTAFKQRVLRELRRCTDMPAVLNHGDLSTKNVLVDERGELTLVDYDDALALNWIADIARMTYWMKYTYDAESYNVYRDEFLRHYADGETRQQFEEIENAFHAWIGLDHLQYFAGRPDSEPKYERALMYFRETIVKLI